jgi:hypothetical protein
MPARGVLYVHACPPAVCRHVEWAVAGVLGVPVALHWTPQPMAPGQFRGQAGWRGPVGTAGRLAEAIRGWAGLRYEVTEEPSTGGDGERYAVTPSLGVFRSPMSSNGDVLVGEQRLRTVLADARCGRPVADMLARLLGEPWDEELEPFRQAGEGGPVARVVAAGQ